MKLIYLFFYTANSVIMHRPQTAITSTVILVGYWTCDLQVAGSIPGWAPLRSGLGQATRTCVPLSQSSIVW